MRKNIFIILFLTSMASSFAQVDIRHNLLKSNIDTVYRKYNELKFKTIAPKNSISIHASCGVPFISNGSQKSEMWNQKQGVGLTFSIDYRRQFMKTTIEGNTEIKIPSFWGLGVGLGLSSFHQSAFMENHTETLNGFTDIDGDLCDVTLHYNGIKEVMSLTYLDIPLYLEMGRASQVKISGYLNVGVKASLLVSGKCAGEGTYTSTGYYPNTNAVYHDVDVLHYYTDKDSYENQEYALSPFVLWGSLSGGVNIPFTNLEKNRASKFILRVGAKIDYTILSVSQNSAAPYFKEANYRINQSNLLDCDGNRLLIPSVEIKLTYCIN